MPQFHLNDSVPTPAQSYAEDLARRLHVEPPPPPPETAQHVTQKSYDWIGALIRFFEKHATLSKTLTILIGVAIIVLICYKAGLFDYLKERFALKRKTPTWDESTVDTDIYAHDLPNELQEADEEQDFPELVKLLYLTALRTLCDRGRLEWLPARTPSDYERLLEKEQAWETPAMRRLTRHYLYVCYGHYEATAELVAECRTWVGHIEQNKNTDPHQSKKGGEA